MKNFIARLLKKKTPEPASAEPAKQNESAGAAVAQAPAPATTTEESLPKKKESLSKGPKIPSEPTAGPAKTEPEHKPASAPVLVPLYGQKDPAPPAAPTPTPSPAPTPAAAAAPAAETQGAPLQHLPFEGDLRQAIEFLVQDLAEVYPQTFEEWETGFRRDDHPEQEIAGWVHLATILKTVSEAHNFSPPQKQDCFNLLIACFTGSRETVRARATTANLTEEQADQVIVYFYEGGY